MNSYNDISKQQLAQDSVNMQHFNMQPMQNHQNPSLHPCSPMTGYYPTSSQSPSQVMPPPILHSTMNQSPDMNEKIDCLVQKVDFLVKKLSTLDTLNEKLGKFETCMSKLSENVEKNLKTNGRS